MRPAYCRRDQAGCQTTMGQQQAHEITKWDRGCRTDHSPNLLDKPQQAITTADACSHAVTAVPRRLHLQQ
jgi:hypothetical protein